MAPNVNLQRSKRQRDIKRDIEKLRKELLKQEKQQKKQQEKEQKKQQERNKRSSRRGNERNSKIRKVRPLLAKERCKRYYENKKQMKMAAEAANLQLNGGASKPTGLFTMISGLGLLIDEEFHIDKDVPITVMGDFNVDAKRNEKAFGFMKKHFDLNMVLTNYSSILGNSYID
ncbi:hypothetical protein AVEN_131976-1 [Araneus ventricosus]|uniref:Uncharacterized protein n=1 Tax=Araneus ventricosus TaxID=182803 RepID=A0A4Y2B4K3_ARAVE|nr:hypothetical protein AVEN_131976-1 [Araneus ventricosus]